MGLLGYLKTMCCVPRQWIKTKEFYTCIKKKTKSNIEIKLLRNDRSPLLKSRGTDPGVVKSSFKKMQVLLYWINEIETAVRQHSRSISLGCILHFHLKFLFRVTGFSTVYLLCKCLGTRINVIFTALWNEAEEFGAFVGDLGGVCVCFCLCFLGFFNV